MNTVYQTKEDTSFSTTVNEMQAPFKEARSQAVSCSVESSTLIHRSPTNMRKLEKAWSDHQTLENVSNNSNVEYSGAVGSIVLHMKNNMIELIY